MRVLHTMIRVGDLDRLTFVGYGPESEHAVIELTYNYGVEKYELGAGFGHIALEVEDAYQACEQIKKRGGKVVREARPNEARHNCHRL